RLACRILVFVFIFLSLRALCVDRVWPRELPGGRFETSISLRHLGASKHHPALRVLLITALLHRLVEPLLIKHIDAVLLGEGAAAPQAARPAIHAESDTDAPKEQPQDADSPTGEALPNSSPRGPVLGVGPWAITVVVYAAPAFTRSAADRAGVERAANMSSIPFGGGQAVCEYWAKNSLVEILLLGAHRHLW